MKTDRRFLPHAAQRRFPRSARSVAASQRGFSLLEVVVAVAILAMALVYIGGADFAAALGSKRYHKTTQAALLMRGLVMDIETYYAEEGFPTNTLEAKSCDEYLPRKISKDFDCEYDLIAIEFDQADLSAMAEQNLADFTQMANACMGAPVNAGDSRKKEGDEDDEEAPTEPEGLPPFESLMGEVSAGMAGAAAGTPALDMQMLCMLLMSPQGQALVQGCGLPSLEVLLQNFMMAAAFFPMIVKVASERTRKLVVRLRWSWDKNKEQEMSITTFIVGIPMEALETLDALQGAGVIPEAGGGGTEEK